MAEQDLSKRGVRDYLRKAIHEVLYDCECNEFPQTTTHQLRRICAAAEQAIQHAEQRERQAAAESRGWDGVEGDGDD